MKRDFFQAVSEYLLAYECTQSKRIEKQLDRKYTSMVSAILNKSWKEQPTNQQLYSLSASDLTNH